MNSQIFDLNNRRKEEFFRNLIADLKNHLDSNAYIAGSLDEERILKRFFEVSKKHPKGPLSYFTFCTKDLISNTDGFVTGGSKFLEDYKPPYNSSVYLALHKAGAINLVNSNLDEFGLGGTGLHGLNGEVKNPVNSKFITGGSSSGSAYLINKGLVDFSIVSDTGDSARQPASYCNVFGFKPSYGYVSRYGFYPFCSGFDTPSIMANSILKIAEVFSVISFPDPKDLCTLQIQSKDYVKVLDIPLKEQNVKIAVLKDTFWSSKERSEESKKIEKEFNDLIRSIKKDLGVSIEVYEFPQELLRLCTLLYVIVSSAESVSNYSNLTGLLFPFEKKLNGDLKFLKKNNGNNYSEILFNNRKSLGQEFKFRQILGMYFLNEDNYEKVYLHSKKVLSLINEEIKTLFRSYDLIISPTSDILPPELDRYKKEYSSSNINNILLLANFCSLPAISIPWVFIDELPAGLHLMAPFGEDALLLNVAKHISDLINKNQK